MLNLPPPDRTPLSNTALPLVVAQVRFDGAGDTLDRSALARVQAALSERGLSCPQVNAVTSADVVLTPGQPAATSTASGWQLVSEEQQVQVTVMPDSASLETSAFRSFDEHFGPQLGAVVEAVGGTLAPVTTRRMGVRFVNVLHAPIEDPSAGWARWVRAALCAPLRDEVLGGGVVALGQQLVLQVSDTVRSTVRAGTVDADGRPAFLLDIDTSVEPAALWSATDVVQGFAELNEHGVAVFQALVTAEMLDFLRTG